VSRRLTEARRKICRLLDSRFLSAFPLALYLFLSGSYFLALIEVLTGLDQFSLAWNSAAFENANEKLQAELLKQKFQLVGYAVTLLLLARRIREVLTFFLHERTLVAVVVALAATTFVSDNPDRVIITLVHLVFGILAVWLYFRDPARQRDIVRSACVVVLFPLMILHIGSLIVWLLHPNAELADLLAGQRLSGLSGNPNTFGGVCIVSAWACFGLISVTPLRSARMAVLTIATCIVLFNAWTTGSATTLLLISAMAAVLVLRMAFSRLGRRSRAGVLLAAASLVICAVFYLAVEQDPERRAQAATEAVGKDLTLTGRTDLWQVALLAFAERPILGWGYDNHETVFASRVFRVPYNHYHNGFLDSLVVGGSIFGVVVIVSFITFFRRYFSVSHRGAELFPLMVIFGTVLIHNMTEYSLFRSNSALWQVWFISFVAIAILASSDNKPEQRAMYAEVMPRRRRRSSTRRMSW